MFKKGWKVLTFVGSFLLVQGGVCFGGGYEGPGLGIRAVSMGGAFVGLADDWTAGYWNPAGLSQLEGKGVGFAMDCLTIKAKDSNSIANSMYNPPNYPDLDQQDMFYQLTGTDEPFQFNKKRVTIISYLPGIGAYSKIKGDFTIELSVYNPVGYKCEWKDTVEGINAFYEETFYVIVYNASLARKVYPNLSLGAGLNILQGKWEKEAKKTSLPYRYKLSLDSDGIGYEGVFGILYTLPIPWDKVKIGGVYRTGTEVSLDGKGSVEHTLLAAVNGKTDYTQKFNYPATYGIGMVYNPLVKLTLSCDWQGTDWTKVRRDVDFDDNSIVTFDKDYDEDLEWKKTGRFRIGGEYNFNENFIARLGFYTDPTPLLDEQVSLTNVLDVDRNGITFGGGYREKDWQIDIGYLYAWGEKTINNVEYERKDSSLQIALSYQF